MPRNILVPVDNTDASETVLNWAIENLIREGDEVHLLNVIAAPMPEVIGGGGYGAMDSILTVEPDPAVDLKHIAEAKEMMKTKFVTKLASRNIPYQVEIVHYLMDKDSIGDAVCKRSAALNAAAVVMAKHQQGKISEFFLGSTTKYCTAHCKSPLVVLHCD